MGLNLGFKFRGRESDMQEGLKMSLPQGSSSAQGICKVLFCVNLELGDQLRALAEAPPTLRALLQLLSFVDTLV